MVDSAVNMSTLGADASSTNDSSANITTSLTTYRQYGVYDDKGQAKGAKSDKPAILSQTQTGKNWEGQEKDGAVVLTENQFKFYTLSDESAFLTLVTDPTQRLYIIQKGLDAIQSAAANKLMAEVQDKTSKDDADVFVYNGDTVDLHEAINTPPQKKFLTDEEKFARAISAMDPNKVAAMLEQFKRNLQAQAGE
jgi:hypothetical protein